MKTALLIRHVPHEGIAAFRVPVEAAGYAIERIDVDDPVFPTLDFVAPDVVVLMGGPMAVYEADRTPWIACEIERLRPRLAAARPTLGVCLGSQMIAAALGARVYPGAREVGFAPVELTAGGRASPLAHLDGVPVLHFHGDTFDLPPRAERLASSAATPNQAFRVGREILAMQFHPEMGLDPRIEAWLEDEDYVRAAGTTPGRVRADYARFGPAIVAAGQTMITQWLEALTGDVALAA